jgi:hypothetical protein
MKSTSIKNGLFLMIAGSVLLLSCDTDTSTTSGIVAGMVSADDDGTTVINTADLKSVTVGEDEITVELTDWLKFMREEEKMARDLYLAFSELYTAPIFSNIARAEDNHMSAVLAVMTTYGIEDPASTERGVFTNPDLQAIYNTLLESGKVSLVEALKVGALVEETDIQDLADVYDLNPGEDLSLLTEALMLGSRNHLRAFNRVLSVNGVDYVPAILALEDFDAIIDSPWEKGTGLCQLANQGNGKKFRGGKGFHGRGRI